MKHHIITWDWKDAPDINELNSALKEITESGNTPNLYTAETDSDDYAWVISPVSNLTQDEVNRIYEEWELEQFND